MGGTRDAGGQPFMPRKPREPDGGVIHVGVLGPAHHWAAACERMVQTHETAARRAPRAVPLGTAQTGPQARGQAPARSAGVMPARRRKGWKPGGVETPSGGSMRSTTARCGRRPHSPRPPEIRLAQNHTRRSNSAASCCEADFVMRPPGGACVHQNIPTKSRLTGDVDAQIPVARRATCDVRKATPCLGERAPAERQALPLLAPGDCESADTTMAVELSGVNLVIAAIVAYDTGERDSR